VIWNAPNPTLLCGVSFVQLFSSGEICHISSIYKRRRVSTKKARKLLGALQKHYPLLTIKILKIYYRVIRMRGLCYLYFNTGTNTWKKRTILN
jgi:hypothetical protein